MAGDEMQMEQRPVPVLAAAPKAVVTTATDDMTSHSTDEDVGGKSNSHLKAGEKSSKKRPSTDDASGTPAPKQTKRRAARACVSCRARKVRCDVVEGAPCGNCRWDKVECVVQESRRRKKNLFTTPTAALPHVQVGNASTNSNVNAEAIRAKLPPEAAVSFGFTGFRRTSYGSLISLPAGVDSGSSSVLDGVAQLNSGLFQRASLCDPALLSRLQQVRHQNAQSGTSLPSGQYPWSSGFIAQDAALFPPLSKTQHFLNTLEQPDPLSHLPGFIKPLPTKTLPEDVKFLHAKGVLTLPSIPLQNACLRCYSEFVHPYMPLMELHDFLSVVNDREGAHGQVSLLLYHAVMFSSCAFVDMKHLRDAGFSTRKAARRAFFGKARHLYDLDYESDRLILVQALLLMSYWYATPDDQKDTWHWMGVAISLAHTIGLHRNPTTTALPLRKQKLWKRIWWSCFMRDRMVALGMRRPTRIKDEDFDVPMLGEDDFEMEPLSDDITLIPPECTLLRDVGKQLQLAQMCIAMAKLCILISRMLKTQYSVLIRDRNRLQDTTNSTMMLFPNKKLENMESVSSCDLDLIQWLNDLPLSCQYRQLSPLDVKNGNSTVAIHRNLLHMVYYTTVSALHRPQFLPSSPHQVPTASRQVQETSRMRVRDSAMQITRMAQELHTHRIDRFLQTSGVTVLLPAMIIHLLEMKNPIEQAREKAARGFRSCMRVMMKLREMYSAADYAIGFLDAALQKASIDMQTLVRRETAARAAAAAHLPPPVATPGRTDQLNTPPPDNAPYLNSTEVSIFHQNRSYMQAAPSQGNPLTAGASDVGAQAHVVDKDMDSAVGMTPSASSSNGSDHGMNEPGTGFGFGISIGEDYDWQEVLGENIDLSQYIHFPTEVGGANTESADVGAVMDLMQAEAVAAARAVEQANLAVDEMIKWPGEEQEQTSDRDAEVHALNELVNPASMEPAGA